MIQSVLLVGAGFLLGTIGAKAVQSEPARKLAVKSVAQGMKIKEGAETLVDEAKAEFDDIVNEASYENAEKTKAPAKKTRRTTKTTSKK